MKQSSSSKGIKIFYAVLVVAVILLAIWEIPSQDKENISNSDTKLTTSGTSPDSKISNKTGKDKSNWTDLVIKPIVENPINQVIFKILFYLIVLVSLFLIIPAGLATLKRFKLFNFEFELVEKEQVQNTIVDLVNIYEGKANYIKELTKVETYQTIVDSFVSSTGKVDFFAALSWFLSDMKLNYKENFDKNINWVLLEVDSNDKFKIIEKDSSGKFNLNKKGNHLMKKSISEEKIQALIDESRFFTTHYLMLPFKQDGKNYVIVVFDYQVGFDALDESILEGLYRIIRLSTDGIEYSILSKKFFQILRTNSLI